MLTDIIFLTISAVIAGAEGWEDIEDFGEDNLEWSFQFVKKVISQQKPCKSSTT
ncbi:hypothetical protein VCR26J2_460044 [Vibrio coralliirubri]|nr:hypothetical protein VCR26J2_460044 [Vibrio coralliirubri]